MLYCDIAVTRPGSVHIRRIGVGEDPLPRELGQISRYGIVEVWSGAPLEDFLQERVFEPLGMTDTGFWVEPEDADRLPQSTGRRPRASSGRIRSRRSRSPSGPS